MNCSLSHLLNLRKIEETRRRIFNQKEYFEIITTYKGFQVLRFYYMTVYRKVGKSAYYFQSEVVQRWIAPNGKYVTMARLRPIYWFQDTWQFHSNLEIRPEKPLYNIIPTSIYSRQQILPQIKRNGFKGEYHELTPFELFSSLLSNNKVETLLKREQFPMMRHIALTHRTVNDYWSAIRICIRNNYLIRDPIIWCDYIELLQFFGKDICNAKYVCPENLTAEHNLYVKKKNNWQEQQRLEQQRKKVLEDEAIYKEMKSKFFGIQFSDGQIQVRVLESVTDFVEEGEKMKHCLYMNNYHLRPDSLIMSATIDNKRIETVEVSLETLKVVQSRGVCNSNTEYHNQIINLVNKNKRLIQKKIAI